MSDSNSSDQNKSFDNLPLWISITAIVLAILSVIFILIAGFGLPIWYGDELAPGIGDRMGGFTAPFIGLLNALLVYIAFRQQKMVNDKMLEEINRQETATKREGFLKDIKQQISDLKQEIASINMKYDATVYVGNDFFYKIHSLAAWPNFSGGNNHQESFNVNLSKPQVIMYFILFSFEKIIEDIESSELLLPTEKIEWILRVKYVYGQNGLNNIAGITGPCSSCSERHGKLAICVYRKFLIVNRKLGGVSWDAPNT